MIARLRGKLWSAGEESLVVDVHGLGYELFCSNSTFDAVVPGDEVDFFVHTHVREDAIQLFGFLSTSERDLFLSLCKVSGIGPRMAMQILSGARAETIAGWIDQGDVKALMQLPKLGKKKAEQLVLSLKGKLVWADSEEAREPKDETQRQLRSALLNLGYEEQRVDKALKEIGRVEDLESGIRSGLGILSAGV